MATDKGWQPSFPKSFLNAALVAFIGAVWCIGTAGHPQAPAASPSPPRRFPPEQRPRTTPGSIIGPTSILTAGDKWEELPMKGAREIELSFFAEASIEVRVGRDYTGRFLARRHDGGKPPLGGTAGSPSKGDPVEVEIYREAGVVYLAPKGAQEAFEEKPVGEDPAAKNAAAGSTPIGEPIDLLIEVPSRAALAVITANAGVFVHGDPLQIPMQLDPYQPPQRPAPGPRIPPGVRPESNPALPPSGSSSGPGGAARPATPAPRIIGGVGGDIEIRTSGGTIKVVDLTANVAIETSAGAVSLERLAGRINVKGGDKGTITAAGLTGPLAVEGCSTVTASGMRARIDAKKVVKRVELHGVLDETRLTLDDAAVEADDLRGRLDLRSTGGAVRLTNMRNVASVDIGAGELQVEGLLMGLALKSAGGALRAERCSGTISVSGSLDRMEVREHTGNLTINAANGNLRAEEIQGDVVASIDNGDITLDRITGIVNVSAKRGLVDIRGLGRQSHVTAEAIQAELTDGTAVTEYYFTAERYVRLTLPDAKYDIKIKADGDIESDFPYEKDATSKEKAEAAEGAPAGADAHGANANPAVPGAGGPVKPPPRPPSPNRGGARIHIVSGGDVEIRKT